MILFSMIRYPATATTASDSTDETMLEANDDDPIQVVSTQDEDPNDEIINNKDVMAEVTLPWTVRKLYLFFDFMSLINNTLLILERRWSLYEASIRLERPNFPILVRRFLYDQLNLASPIPSHEILESAYPTIEGNICTFNSAIATFHAPSDISGITGIRREFIRATSSWRNGPARYDCVLVNANPDVDHARGFEIARVFLFFSFLHQDRGYPCALIQWFSFVGTERDEDTGYWIVEPDVGDDHGPDLAVIHVDSIFRAVHLMPVTGSADIVPRYITMDSSLDTFNLFYVNNFVDHHAFATL
jgi:hypothetical protein